MSGQVSIDRLNSSLSDRYRIERQIGEGGTATVYLAEDLRHNRRVALKVLKPELAAAVGAERFLAEIETTARLTHPNILPLHDSGEADGAIYFVMPYVDGESLRERLDREHQLPVEDAVQLATSVAEALEYAHSEEVIHRDIKPANILLQAGKPVVSDFGIALALGTAGGRRLTETGLSMGTPSYMSPEQATGDLSVGAATDIYALGCVLYEMLAGEPPHTGSTPQAILGKIVTGDADPVTKHRPAVPANVDAAIRKALERLPADRFTRARDLAHALGEPGFRHGGAGAVRGGGDARTWRRATFAAVASSVGLAVALGWALTRPEPTGRVERFASPFGDSPQARLRAAGMFRLSTDGSMLVFRAGPRNQLWVRAWGDLEPYPVRGTEGGAQPAVSPDGEQLALRSDGRIIVMPLDGGPTIALGTGSFPTWADEGYVYAAGSRGIVRWPETGGTEEQITTLAENEVVHHVGDVLPGGGGLLMNVFDRDSRPEIRALDLRTGEQRLLTEGRFPQFSLSRHLVFEREGTLMAAAFDPDALELRSPPAPVIDSISFFSVSRDGKLFYSRGGLVGASQPRQLVWVERTTGNVTPVDPNWWFDGGDANAGWSLSPGGTRLAIRALTEDGYDIWVKELETGPLTRVTFWEGEDRKPRWAPGGEALTFLSNRGGNLDVWTKEADGTGPATLLFDEEASLAQGFWTPDGEWLVMRTLGEGATEGGRDILATQPGVVGVPFPLLAREEYDEKAPAISRDSRWIAYVSTETGREEVFVRPFPDVETGRVQVSTDGGIQPYWAHNGRELFYTEPESRRMFAAAVQTGPTFQVVDRESLFTIPEDIDVSFFALMYDVTPDDRRFLMSRVYGGTGESNIFVMVRNFDDELTRRVPVS